MCVDQGPNGKTDAADYSSVTLEPSRPRVHKSFFVRFLRAGVYTIGVELQDRADVLVKTSACEGGEATVLDRLAHRVVVTRRVDVDEHYRQIVLQAQRRPLNGGGSGGGGSSNAIGALFDASSSSVASAAATVGFPIRARLISTPDVIRA